MFNKFRENIHGREATVVKGLGAFSLPDTLECGQIFRFEPVENEIEGLREYIITAYGLVIDAAQREVGELILFGMSDEDFDAVIPRLFFMVGSLDEIKADIISRTSSEWLRCAAECAGGIAILGQEPWEMLISFIISQNNNIPRIKKIIKQICIEYGVNLTLQGKTPGRCPINPFGGTPCQEKCERCGVCYTFPSAEEILSRPEGLLPSRPGFRYSYILDAAEKVYSGEVRLDMIAAARSYTHTVECLKRIKGVGDKVASCAALFGFGNLEAFPIDVWMRRAIDTYFGGELDPTTLGRYAGVAQQYIFHYIRNIEAGEKK